jgi:hypothetical protein
MARLATESLRTQTNQTPFFLFLRILIDPLMDLPLLAFPTTGLIAFQVLLHHCLGMIEERALMT